MKKAIGLLLGVCFLAMSTQAHALFTLDFAGAGLGTTTYTAIKALELTGEGTVEQFTPGGLGVVAVGNTFIQTTTEPFFSVGTGYFPGAGGFIDGLLGTDSIGLRVVDGQLDGSLTDSAVIFGETYFSYEYVPGDLVELVYDNGVDGEVVIAEIEMLKGGGVNQIGDTIGFGTGTFNLLGQMTVNYDNLIFVNGWDVFDFPSFIITLATYDGSINLGEPFGVTPDSFSQTVFIGGEMAIYATPEPATMTLLGIGVLGAAFLRRRNRRSN